MKHKASIVCIIGLSIALIGCDSVPEATSANCAGKGMEQSLMQFRNDEAARQAFLDKCNAINAAD